MVLLNQVDRVNRSFLLHVYIWSCGSFFKDTDSYFTIMILFV